MFKTPLYRKTSELIIIMCCNNNVEIYLRDSTSNSNLYFHSHSQERLMLTQITNIFALCITILYAVEFAVCQSRVSHRYPIQNCVYLSRLIIICITRHTCLVVPIHLNGLNIII